MVRRLNLLTGCLWKRLPACCCPVPLDSGWGAAELKPPSVRGGCLGVLQRSKQLPWMNCSLDFLAHGYFPLSQSMLSDFGGSWTYVKGRVLSYANRVCHDRKKSCVWQHGAQHNVVKNLLACVSEGDCPTVAHFDELRQKVAFVQSCYLLFHCICGMVKKHHVYWGYLMLVTRQTSA